MRVSAFERSFLFRRLDPLRAMHSIFMMTRYADGIFCTDSTRRLTVSEWNIQFVNARLNDWLRLNPTQLRALIWHCHLIQQLADAIMYQNVKQRNCCDRQSRCIYNDFEIDCWMQILNILFHYFRSPSIGDTKRNCFRLFPIIFC